MRFFKKVVGINGSPRIGGNTDILLDNVLEGAKDRGAAAEKIILSTFKFSPCRECENIKGDGTCIIEDDMRIIYRKIEEADAVILASPIFFGSLSAQTKMMVDRFQCRWKAKKGIGRKKRAGAFIYVEGSMREDFFDNAKAIVKNLFAVIGLDYKEELFCQGLNEKGSVLKHPEFLKKAFELGQRMASG
ncbi:MAG: flavodoxin family protein [Candidatus Omnitrophota bacterium]|nr:flavodoxin family protein [Candidatus Omnitrophota bacterium]